MVLFAVSIVCLFHLVCMVLCLFIIYGSLKICIQIFKNVRGWVWRSAMRATQTAWNFMSYLEEATLHPGLYKRLRAVVVVCFSDCSVGGGSVGPVPWLGHCSLESRVCKTIMLKC